MEEKKPGLPITQFIKLDTTPEQWDLLANKAIESLPTTGLIKKDEETQLKIKIEIVKVLNPKQLTRRHGYFTSNLDQTTTESMARVQQFFYEQYHQKIWLIFGIIKGKKEFPIVMFYYEKLDVCIYSIKQQDEDVNKFFG